MLIVSLVDVVENAPGNVPLDSYPLFLILLFSNAISRSTDSIIAIPVLLIEVGQTGVSLHVVFQEDPLVLVFVKPDRPEGFHVNRLRELPHCRMLGRNQADL